MKPLFILLFATSLMVGCTTTPNRIPDARYLIGGGQVYSGIAPKNGTFIVVEQTSKTIISTLAVNEGKPLYYEIKEEVITDDPKGFKKTYGIPFSKARFRAYFIPGK